MRLGGETELNDMFRDCTNLEKVYLPQNAISVHETFYGCGALKQVIFGNKLSGIWHETFYDCEMLKEIELPGSVSEITSLALLGCNIETIVFEEAPRPQLFRTENVFSRKYHDKTISVGKKVLFTIFSPFLFLYSMLQLLFSKTALLAIGALLTLPISFWVFMLRPLEEPFYVDSAVQTIYLRRDGGKAVKLKAFRRVKSDREGYDQYIRRRKD